MFIHDEADLRAAFEKFGSPVWIRAVTGAAGKQSLPATNLAIAREWINFWDGWGSFVAAEYLAGVAGPRRTSVTWMSLWKAGELIVAQGRERLSWAYADRAPSGITGLTGVGRTIARRDVDEIASRAILAIDQRPDGIFSVDLTEDKDGVPCPTEINIGRFFTTHQFFTDAGLNMPDIYVKLAFGEMTDMPRNLINPLPEGLCWIRSIDCEPVLANEQTIEASVQDLQRRLKTLEERKSVDD
jgi:carbamoyl-phosphate synthase large subunit